MAKDVDDLRNAQVALTPHTITLDKKSKSNLTFEVYPELKRKGNILVFIFRKSNVHIFFLALVLLFALKLEFISKSLDPNLH